MYQSLQACRAAAALLVVLFHLGVQFSLEKSFNVQWMREIVGFGHAGVYFFFVLSGFIIVCAHRRDFFKPDRFLAYARKRAVRIYPTYWIVFGAACAAVAAFPALRTTLPHDVATFVRSILLLPQDASVVGSTGAPVIDVAWSLQYEIAFYALVGCFILGWLPAAAAITFMLLSWAACYRECTFPLSFFGRTYVALFCLGAAVAFLCQSTVSPRRPVVIFALGALAFFTLGFAESMFHALSYNSPASALEYGLASCAIIYGLVKAEDLGIVFGKHRWVQTLGEASYALYLIHYPIIGALNKVAFKVELSGTTGAVVSYLPILACCMAASVLFHLWIEKPLLKYLQRWQPFARH